MYKILILVVFLFSPSISFGLNVDETIKNTVNNNNKIKIALEKLIESKELIEKALGAKLPTLTSTISGTYSNADTTTSSITTNSETFTDKYSLSLNQNLYDAGYNDLEIERSKILYDDEIINFYIVTQDLILDAITGYLTVINYEKSMEANKKNYELVSKALEEIKTTYDIGTSTLYDLQSTESFYAISNASLFSSKKNLELSKKSFKRIVGLEAINLEDIIEIDENINLDIILKNTVSNNLNLKLIANNIKNQNILLLKEKKSKHPNLDITGTAEYSDSGRIDNGSETTKGSIALTLTVPIYQQGIDNSNIRKIHSQILQLELNYEDFIDDLEIQISNVYKDYVISKKHMESNLAVIRASETALKSLNEEYNMGTKTIIDIVEEEEKLLSTNVDYLNSKTDYLINYFTLKSLEGTLLKSFENYLPSIN